MIKWLNLPDERKVQIINQVANITGLPAYAIEKDWWVTLALKAAFSTPWQPHLVFKGGTSLSKSWGLIERFSEDIDLAIDRKALGFEEMISKTQVGKLRKASSEFVSTTFKNDFEKALTDMGITPNFYAIKVQPSDQPDIDPRILELSYTSVIEPNAYIQNKVLIEIGARSLREPCSARSIRSIITETLTAQAFSVAAFDVMFVEPQRTFLEKVFLLHEEFLKPKDKMKPGRKSRHFYDLERLMDTEYAMAAFNDKELFHSIVEHRKNITPVRGINYDDHRHDKVDFIPPADVIAEWEKDYNDMREMIYGDTLTFPKLIERLIELRNKFRAVTKEIPALPTGEKLEKIIKDAKAAIDPDFNYMPGSAIKIPVSYLSDPKSPSTDGNLTERFLLTFHIEGDQLIYQEIEKQ